MPSIVIDFETASACDLKLCGSWVYAEHPTTEILCLCFAAGGRVVTLMGDDLFYGDCELQEMVDDPEVMFVAHNAGFEKAIWRSIMVPTYGWPDIPNSRFHDTLATCAMKALPLDLDRVAMALRLPHQKDKEGSRLTIGMSKPNKAGYYDRSPEKLTRVGEYCGQDVRTQAALHRRVGGLGPERAVWLLDQRINERGVRLDMEFVRAAQQVVDRASIPLLAEFAVLTGGLKPGQTVKVREWCAANGLDIPNLQKETLAKLLGAEDEADDEDEAESDTVSNNDPDNELGHVDLPENVRRALHIRQLIGSASIKKLKRMEHVVAEDGRVHGLLQYHGSGPGRWTGRLFQPQNFPRGTLKLDGNAPSPDLVVAAIMTGDPEYVELMLGPPVEAVVSGLRHALVATPGRRFVSGDFAGIQARTVLALAGQFDKTALMASGADVYCDMASQIYKRPIDKKKDPAERQTGKNSVLGLGFQMGWKKFRDKYGQGQEAEFFEEVVRVYRKEWAPKVPYVWYGLEDAAVRTVHHKRPHEAYGVRYALEDGWLTATAPSGSKIWYFNPVATRKAMPWDDTDIRMAFTFQQMKMGQWRTIDAFGGLLTENVVMRLEVDLLIEAMFKAEKNGFPICLTVHDELVTEPLIADADEKALEQLMTDVPQWARDMQIPIAVETWTGDRYRK